VYILYTYITAFPHLTARPPFMMVSEWAIKLFPRAKITVDDSRPLFSRGLFASYLSGEASGTLPKTRDNYLSLTRGSLRLETRNSRYNRDIIRPARTVLRLPRLPRIFNRDSSRPYSSLSNTIVDNVAKLTLDRLTRGYREISATLERSFEPPQRPSRHSTRRQLLTGQRNKSL